MATNLARAGYEVVARTARASLSKLGHMQKDVSHLLRAARQLGALPGVAGGANEAYGQAVEQRLGEQDFVAVIEPIATKFGLK